MERVLSVEEKIRRAEEIYERRKQGNTRPIATVNVNDKKDIKLLKKMIIQILVCVSIYLIIYVIQNNDYVFSEDVIKKVNEVISYDTNFYEMYENIKNYIVGPSNKENESISPNESIGGAEQGTEEAKDNQDENTNSHEDIVEKQDTISQVEESSQETPISQAEQDIIDIKNTTSFLKPVQGVISSKYGQRETATGNVPKNHTGTDIAANTGIKIISATDGEVVLASEEGDYRKTFKNTDRGSEHNICSL